MMFSTVKKVFSRAMGMCNAAYIIFRGAVMLSCAMACAALICLVVFNAEGWLWAKNLAADFIELPAAILLVSIIGSAVIEDISQ